MQQLAQKNVLDGLFKEAVEKKKKKAEEKKEKEAKAKEEQEPSIQWMVN